MDEFTKIVPKVNIAELTIPFDVNIDWAQQRKMEKYEELR